MIFYRHPTPDARPGLCYGRLDLDINAEGRAQVAAACAGPVATSRIVSSPAKRAMALAQPLAAKTGAKLTIDHRLWEMDFGAWEGKLWDDIDRSESDPWAEDVFTRAPPGGETFSAMYARVSEVLKTLVAADCVVTHAGPIRAAYMALTDASFDDVFAKQVPFAEPLEIPTRTN